jgi:membrane-associated protease RseP (regulator of RpoE activity)
MASWILAVYFVIISWFLMVALEKRGWLFGERHMVFLLLRTKNGRDLISRIARFRRFWRVFSTVGVFVGVSLMSVMMASILYNLYSSFFMGATMMTAKAVIPGVTIPLWYGIIGLVSVLLVHEFSHGIVARSEDVSLKSLGAVFLTVFPVGAFVEPDEDELKSKSRLARLRVYSAGSFANIVLAVLAMVGLVLYTGYVFDQESVQIVAVVKGSPAEGVLHKGMVIERIDGRDLGSIEDFYLAAREIPPDADLVVGTDTGQFTVHTAPRKEDPDRGFVGIQVHFKVKDGISRYFGLAAPLFIFYSLYWIFFLNQGIGLINLAPLHLGVAATDGYHILRETLSRFLDESQAEKVSLFVSFSMVFFLLFGVVNPSPAGL